MRTATTIAKGHDGKWTIVHSPDVDLLEQHSGFRKLLSAVGVHAQFSEVRFQESDQRARVLKFITPEAQAEREKQRAAIEAQLKKDAEAKAKAAAAKKAKADKEAADKQAAFIKAEKAKEEQNKNK
jgi:hypothetical protein